MRLACLLVVLFASVAEAQFTAPKGQPPVCTVKCEGTPGPKGEPGPRGPAGPQGPAGVCPARAWRPFDLGAHGLPFPVIAVVTDRFCQKRVIAYSPSALAAVLVNPDTGIGQVAYGFTADLSGGITFDAVTPLDGWTWLLWGHRGGWWLHQWPLGLPEVDLRSVMVPHPRGGAPEPLFRWR